MFRGKSFIYLSHLYFTFIVLGNTAIVMAGYVYDQDYYWTLFLSVPYLLFVIYKTWYKGKNVLTAKVSYHSPLYSNKMNWTVFIGNEQCSERRLSSIFTVGIREKLRKKVYPKTRENGIDEKHEPEELITTLNLTGGDRIWRIEPGYNGCRLKSGQFSAEIFKANVRCHNIKAIEITLLLSKVKDNEIGLNEQSPNKIQAYVSNGSHSYCGYSGFYNADGMIHFIESLRDFSGGKPIGLKIRIHDKKEFQKICHAICKTRIIPDFIVVEGDEIQNNSALNIENNCSMPLYEALQFVSTTLQNYGLDRQILIIAKASITSGFDMVKALAFGAHAVRTVMSNNGAINYQDKGFSNIDNMSSYYPLPQLSVFQQKIIEDMARVMESLGFKSVEEMSPASFFRKLCVLDTGEFKDRNDFLLSSKPSKILIKTSSPGTPENRHIVKRVF